VGDVANGGLWADVWPAWVFSYKFAAKTTKTNRPRDRYAVELQNAFTYSIALEGRAWSWQRLHDCRAIATFSWVRNLIGFGDAGDLTRL
jgi:hypothetical protein